MQVRITQRDKLTTHKDVLVLSVILDKCDSAAILMAAHGIFPKTQQSNHVTRLTWAPDFAMAT